MPERSGAQLVAYAVAAVLAVVAGYKLLAPDDRGGRAAEGVRVERKTAGSAGGTGARLYVHVAGAVRRPGLYRLRDGARVAAALDRAGGPTRRAELSGVNLAAPLEDGQQIVVPGPGARPAAGGPGTAGGTKISLASATVEQLDQLDGIGPTLAKRIVGYRDEHGGFRSVDELKQVEGIGEKRFDSLREAVAP